MIDLTNYETWFLLYADNELSAEERDMVLSFVKEHSSLKASFDSILNLKFSPDEYPAQIDKNALSADAMKTKMEASLKEHELLLEYIDGELSNKEMIEVDSRLQHDDRLRTINNELIKLTLQSDKSIAYPDKSELYKYDKTILFDWKKTLAIAASLIVVAGLVWTFRDTPNGINDVNASVVKTEEQIKPKGQVPSLQTISLPQNTLIAIKTKKPIKGFATQQAIKFNQKVEPASVQRTDELSVSFTENKVEAGDQIQLDTKPVSNNLAPYNAVPNNELVENSFSNTGFSNDDSYDEPKKEGKKPFKLLSRKISRLLGKERQESDQIKFIQVANFQFAVSKQ